VDSRIRRQRVRGGVRYVFRPEWQNRGSVICRQDHAQALKSRPDSSLGAAQQAVEAESSQVNAV